MQTVVAPDAALKEVDSGTNGLRYHRKPDGTFRVTDADAKDLVAYGGFIKPTMGVAKSRRDGYRCTGCGFGSWFRRCSRCGEYCKREYE